MSLLGRLRARLAGGRGHPGGVLASFPEGEELAAGLRSIGARLGLERIARQALTADRFGDPGRVGRLLARLLAEAEARPAVEAADLALLLELMAVAGPDQPEQAAGHLGRALSLRAPLLPPGHPDLARTRLLLGAQQMATGDLPGALATLRPCLAAIDAGATAIPRLRQALSLLGSAEKKAGDPAAAEACYRRLVALEEQQGDRLGLATASLNLGAFLFFAERRAEAIPYLNASLAALEAGPRPGPADLARQLAIAYREMGDVARARRAQALAEDADGAGPA